MVRGGIFTFALVTLFVLTGPFNIMNSDALNNELEFLQKEPLTIFSDLGNASNPSMIRTSDGYLLSFCSDHSGNKDIWVANSPDGRNWSSPVQVTENANDDFDPCLIQLSNGTFMISFTSISIRLVYQYGLPKILHEMNIMATYSDDGLIWSEPLLVSNISKYGGGTAINSASFHFSKIIQMPDGEILVASVFFNMGCLGIRSWTISMMNSSTGRKWDVYLSIQGWRGAGDFPINMMVLENGTIMIFKVRTIRGENVPEFIYLDQNLNLIGREECEPMELPIRSSSDEGARTYDFTNCQYIYSYNLSNCGRSMVRLDGSGVYIADNGSIRLKNGSGLHTIALGNFSDPCLISDDGKLGIVYLENNTIKMLLPSFQNKEVSDDNDRETESDEDEKDGAIYRIIIVSAVLFLVIMMLIIIFIMHFMRQKKIDQY